jgi:hypothetical protein
MVQKPDRRQTKLTVHISAAYDKNHDGKLGRAEVIAMLTELNNGKPPLEEEVDYVFSLADWDKSGDLTRTEIKIAISTWYGLVDKRLTDESCCSLL